MKLTETLVSYFTVLSAYLEWPQFNLELAHNRATNHSTMAIPLPPGLTPSETAFLCEMEMVTVIPRQRLEGLNLLGVS